MGITSALHFMPLLNILLVVYLCRKVGMVDSNAINVGRLSLTTVNIDTDYGFKFAPSWPWYFYTRRCRTASSYIFCVILTTPCSNWIALLCASHALYMPSLALVLTYISLLLLMGSSMSISARGCSAIISNASLSISVSLWKMAADR